MATKTPEAEVKVLEKEIIPFVQKAEKLVVIRNAKDMEAASEARTQLKKYSKQITAVKETVTKPLNAALKAARALFATVEDRVEESLTAIDKAMIAYQTEQKRIADEKEAKIAARVGEGKGKLKAETAIEKMGEIEKPSEKVATESGGTQFITVPVFKVVDVTKLPAEYLLPNEVKIRAAMKAGIQLPGVEYSTEERPRDIS